MIWQNAYVADTVILLRGVNVGGHRIIPMQELRDLLGRSGFGNVETLLQSGNAIVDAGAQTADETEVAIADLLERQYEVRIDIHARQTPEWARLRETAPLEELRRTMPSRVLVTFFRQPIPSEYVDALRAFAKDGEVVEVAGRELYTAYPNGISNSKLDRMPGWSKVAAGGTARNWNTVQKIQTRLEARAA